MKILKNEIKEYIHLLTNISFINNKIDKYNALFFPIETDGLTEDYSQTVILTEFKETSIGFSNSAKPGILYDPEKKEATLAYIISDNEQKFDLKIYVSLCKALGLVDNDYTSPILDKESYLVNKERIIFKL